jgi:DNA-binding transcriptional regulator YiaG
MSVYCDSIEFVTITCCECRMPFGMSRSFYDAKRKDHKTFTCPAGHEQHFTGKSEEDKLREEVERKTQMIDAANQRAHRLERQRDDVAKAHKRMRDRIRNGVCPCCNRTFQNLLRHMQTEHSDQPPLRTLREAYGLTQANLADEIGVTTGHVSAAERGKPVVAYAQHAIDSWVDRQAPAMKKEMA